MSVLPLLDTLIAAAVEAGSAIDEIYRGDFQVRHKADDSPVTVADHRSEAIILERLRQAVPDVPIVAEEEVAAGRVPAVDGQFFLVDPLDGTKEFVERRDEFTVNIALVRSGEPVLGVVYAPARSLLFAGDVERKLAFRATQQPGVPPTRKREAIHVRSVPARGLTVVASRSHSTPETDAYLATQPVADRVSIGSSLKFCLVASGEADFYPRLGPTMEWDTAAGHAVLAAAGGMVLAPDGSPLRYGKPGFRNTSFVATGVYVPPPLPAE